MSSPNLSLNSGSRSIALPVCFMLFGLASLIAGAFWLVFEPQAISAFHYAPHTVAVTHLFILGFILSVTMGAVYQLVPVAMETKLAFPRLGFHQFGLHSIGVIGMVISFYHWRMSDLSLYGTLVFAGMLLFAFNVAVTLKRAPRFDAVGGFILASVIWLFLTMTAGLMIAGHKQHPFLPWQPLAILNAHAHLGLIGMFVMIIAGVSLRLVPMFALSELQSPRRAWWTLGLLNAGLPLLVAGLLGQSKCLTLLASAVLAAGLGVYAVEIRKIIAARKRRQLDWGLKMFFTALGLLYVATGCGLALACPWFPASFAQFATAYALLGIFGVIGLAIIGMLHKILPFLVWFRVYSPLIGKAKLPVTGEMFSPTLAGISFAHFLVGLALACVAAVLESDAMAAFGAILLSVGCLAFLINMALVFRHWIFPEIEPLKR